MADMRGETQRAEVSAGSTGKIVAAIIVALAVLGVGVWSYTSGAWNPSRAQTSVVSDSALPSPG